MPFRPAEGNFVSKSNANGWAIPKMAVFPGPREWSRARRVRRDVAVTWGFPEPSAGLPRPSLLFDGRRKKRLRLWREGRKRRDDDGGNDEKGFLLEFAQERRERQQFSGVFF